MKHMRLATVASLLLVACGATPAPRAQAVSVPPVSSASPQASVPVAAEALCEGPEACLATGIASFEAGNPRKAAETFERACRIGARDPDACAWLVRARRAVGQGATTRAFDSAAAPGCSLLKVRDADHRAVRAEACFVVAEQRRAAGLEDGAGRALLTACKLGSETGCAGSRESRAARGLRAEAAEPPNETEEAAGVSGLGASPPGGSSGGSKPRGVQASSNTLRIASLNADGVALREIACQLEGGGLGGLLGGMTLGAGFAPRRGKLDACSPRERAETPVTWTATGGRIKSAKATGPDSTKNACVERALSGAASTVSGTCSATFVHGRGGGAAAAATR